QIALEDEHFAVARGVNRVIFLDTDLLSAVVYNNHYYGHCPEWIEDAARARRPDLYLLCETDVPWIADGVRDRGDRRDEMQALFRAAVIASGSDYMSIHGGPSERIERATRAIDAL
ncbi:MAG TPA: ATP-binding protein, partial [Gemmatimonadaceae bacterium]